MPFDLFDLSDPLTQAILVTAEEEGWDRELSITVSSPDEIDAVVAWVEEHVGPEQAREVRRRLEEHFGLR